MGLFVHSFKAPHVVGYEEHTESKVLGYTTLPANYENEKDWRADGAVGPIRNEGGICQSCWAFAVQSALESAHYIESGGKLEVFSPQQLVDCDRYSMGCSGGGLNSAFDYFKTAPIMLEKDYPYLAKD